MGCRSRGRMNPINDRYIVLFSEKIGKTGD
jgi:hypothetical protein